MNMFKPAEKGQVSALSEAVNNRASQKDAFRETLQMESKRIYIEASMDDKVDILKLKRQLDMEVENQMAEWKRKNSE
jgi:hypothetical protein